MIEEAAGISKYRRRKEKAERRLEATEGALLRAQDLLKEVRRQFRPLERQAEAARRHAGVISELVALRRYLHGRELNLLGPRLSALGAARAEARRSQEVALAGLARLDARVSRRRGRPRRRPPALGGHRPGRARLRRRRAPGTRLRAGGA